MKNSLCCISALLVSVSLLATRASAQEQSITCKDIPVAVRTSFENAYPKATIQECAREVENKKTAYEISSTEGKTKRDVLFNEDGTLIVVEEAIDPADLPEAVAQTLSEAFADHAIELVEKLTRDETVTFEIRSKEPLELVFDGAGKVLSIAAASAEGAAAETQQHEENEGKEEGEGEEQEEGND